MEESIQLSRSNITEFIISDQTSQIDDLEIAHSTLTDELSVGGPSTQSNTSLQPNQSNSAEEAICSRYLSENNEDQMNVNDNAIKKSLPTPKSHKPNFEISYNTSLIKMQFISKKLAGKIYNSVSDIYQNLKNHAKSMQDLPAKLFEQAKNINNQAKLSINK
jgi:hypothetical protein